MSNCPDGGADTGPGSPDGSRDSATGPDANQDSSSPDSGQQDSGQQDSGQQEDSSQQDSGTHPDSGDSGACPAPPATPGLNGGPVTLSSNPACTLTQYVSASLHLQASQCPVYDAPQGLAVGGHAVLTIDPGVTVAFGPGASLQVGGAGTDPYQGLGQIVVNGTACSPVVFTSDSPGPTPGIWGVIDLESGAAGSTINNLTVQYAGTYNQADGITAPPGAENCTACSNSSFLVDGINGDITVPLVGVTLSNNANNGFAFFGAHTGPAPGSTLTVTDWPATSDPFTIDFDAAGLLANATLSVGTKAAGTVHLVNTFWLENTGLVDKSEHWPSLPPALSYILGKPTDGETPTSAFSINITTTTSTPTTLTIDAPNTLRIGSQLLFNVDNDNTGSPTGLAALVANGTPTNPIVFEGLVGASPLAGSWQGFQFNATSPSVELASSLTYVTIDGASSEFGLVAGPEYGAIALYATYADPSVHGCVPGPTLSDITFKDLSAGGYGILAVDVSQATAVALGASGNTFPPASPGSPVGIFTFPPTGTPPVWQCQ